MIDCRSAAGVVESAKLPIMEMMSTLQKGRDQLSFCSIRV
jgi:hypothetical protein